MRRIASLLPTVRFLPLVLVALMLVTLIVGVLSGGAFASPDNNDYKY